MKLIYLSNSFENDVLVNEEINRESEISTLYLSQIK